MIDTDKYEGHTSDWKWIDVNEQNDFYLHGEHQIICHDTPDGKLAQDAPLLLAEVKRLREGMKMMLDDMKFSKPEEEIEYWLDTWKYWLKELIE